MPSLSSIDAATRAASDLVSALLNPVLAAPFAIFDNAQLNALKELSANFDSCTRPFTSPPPTTPVTHHMVSTRPVTRLTPAQPAATPPRMITIPHSSPEPLPSTPAVTSTRMIPPPAPHTTRLPCGQYKINPSNPGPTLIPIDIVIPSTPFAPYPPLPNRIYVPPQYDNHVSTRYNLRSDHRPTMIACNATISKHYSAATAYLARHP